MKKMGASKVRKENHAIKLTIGKGECRCNEEKEEQLHPTVKNDVD